MGRSFRHCSRLFFSFDPDRAGWPPPRPGIDGKRGARARLRYRGPQQGGHPLKAWTAWWLSLQRSPSLAPDPPRSFWPMRAGGGGLGFPPERPSEEPQVLDGPKMFCCHVGKSPRAMWCPRADGGRLFFPPLVRCKGVRLSSPWPGPSRASCCSRPAHLARIDQTRTASSDHREIVMWH